MATRFTNCGVRDPPFTDGDVFDLEITGKKTPIAPYTGISFTCGRNVKVGEPLVLSLSAQQSNPPSNPGETSRAQQNALTSAYGMLEVVFDWGSDPGEVDPNPLDAAAVTVLAFPAKDGDALTVRFHLHFTDNRTLDQTFSTPLERRTCWRTEDFKAFGRIARRDDEECWRHFEEEQRRETVESRRKPTGANMFGALVTAQSGCAAG